MKIIDRIVYVMEKKNIKAYKLAEKTGLNSSTFSSWKTRHINPPAEDIPKIAEAIGVSLSFIMTGHEEAGTRIRKSEEVEFLELFRRLDDREKGRILGRMDSMLEDHSKAKEKKLS